MAEKAEKVLHVVMFDDRPLTIQTVDVEKKLTPSPATLESLRLQNGRRN